MGRKIGVTFALIVLLVGVTEFASNADVIRAASYMRLGQHERALAIHDVRVSKEPNNPLWHYNRAVALLSISSDRALEAFNDALRLDPRMVRAGLGRSLALLHLGDKTGAFASVDAATRNASTPAERGAAYVVEAALWLADEQPVEALHRLNQARAEAPEPDGKELVNPDELSAATVSCSTSLLRSIARRSLGQHAAAASDARDAVQCNRRHPVAQFNAILAFEAAGELQEAESLRKSIASQQSPEQLAGLGSLTPGQLAMMFLQSQQPPAADIWGASAASQTSAAVGLLLVLLVFGPKRDRAVVLNAANAPAGAWGRFQRLQDMTVGSLRLRSRIYGDFSLPIFASGFVVATLAFAIAFLPDVIVHPGGLLVAAAMWGATLCMGYPLQALTFLIVPGAFAWFLTESAHWCLAILGGTLSLSYARVFRQSLVFEMARDRNRLATGLELDGRRANALSKLSARLLCAVPFLVGLSKLLTIARESKPDKLGFLLTYTPPDTTWAVLPALLIAYAGLGISFPRWVMAAHQNDWLAASRLGLGSSEYAILMPGTRLFHALAFLTLDFWLTAMTLTGQSAIPTVTPAEIALASSLIKIPSAIVAVTTVGAVWLNASFSSDARLAVSAEELIGNVQTSFGMPIPAEHVHANEFLDSLQ